PFNYDLAGRARLVVSSGDQTVKTASRKQVLQDAAAHPVRRGRAWSWVAGLLLTTRLALSLPAAHGQPLDLPSQGAPAAPIKSYVNRSVFHLPVMIDDRSRAGLRELQLFVRESPERPWTLREKAPPTAPGFTYRAGQDGEYWFTVVTVDANGKPSPADVNAEPPG